MSQAAGVFQACIHYLPSERALQTLCLPNYLQHSQILSKTLLVTSDSDVTLLIRANEMNSKLTVQQKYLVQFQLLLDKIDWCVSRRWPAILRRPYKVTIYEDQVLGIRETLMLEESYQKL